MSSTVSIIRHSSSSSSSQGQASGGACRAFIKILSGTVFSTLILSPHIDTASCTVETSRLAVIVPIGVWHISASSVWVLSVRLSHSEACSTNCA